MTRPDSVEFFEQKYAASRARAARRIEEAAFGQRVGLNGYTTTEEAQTLREYLDLAAAATLLDVGGPTSSPC